MTRLPSRLLSLSLAVALGAVASPAAADEGRSEALVGNPLVRDDVDIIDFPGLLTTYGNLVFLSVRENATTGDVGAVVGRRFAYGVWIHRTPRFDDLATTDELFDSFDLPETYHLADLYFGMDNGFGVRLSFSAGLRAEDDEAVDTGDLVSTGGTTMGVDLQLGYSLDRRSYHGDNAVGLTMSYFSVVDEGVTTYETGWAPSFFIRHRSVANPRRLLSWVFDLQVARRAYTATAEGATNAEGAFGRWVTSLVGGPRLTLPGGLTVWVGAQLAYENLAGEVDGTEQPTLHAFGPGAVASAELVAWDILSVRAGVRYDFFWAETSTPETTLESATGEQELGQRFQWSIGLGVELSGFRLDGTISHELIFGGPSAIGGGTPGLAGTVSAAYAW
jgi:hypothetical protein